MTKRTTTSKNNYSSFADLVNGEANNRSVFLKAFEKVVRTAMHTSSDPELRAAADDFDIRDLMEKHCAARKWILTLTCSP